MQIILGILVLSLLVLLHELGHFAAAKLLKIPVLVFSIGFGKPLLKKKIGETEYRICPILFGGFVQMEGDEPGKPSENGFNSRPIWQRATVAIAGPMVNLVTAFLFLLVMYTIGTPFASYLDSTKIGFISNTSPAYNKLMPGDVILTINGSAVEEWEEVDIALKDLSKSHKVLYSRNGIEDSTEFTIAIPDPDKIDQFDHGIAPFLLPVVGDVGPGTPAAKGNLQTEDTILALNNTPINGWYQIPEVIAEICKDSAQAIVFTVKSDTIRNLEITPEYNSDAKRYLAGFSPRAEFYIRKYSGSEIIMRSKNKFIDYFLMIFDVLGKVGRGEVSVGHLSGPLAIIMISGTAAQAGIAALLNFMALISINLGVLNLMPLVITDGGILSLLCVEAIMKKPVPEKVQQSLATAFTLIFISLFVFVSFHDIIRIPLFFGK